MSKCLRCNKPCVTATIFCDECRLLLHDHQVQQGEHQYQDVSEITTARQRAVFDEKSASVSGNPLERLTVQYPEVEVSPMLSPSTPYHVVEQAFQRLGDAARRITSFEPAQGHRKPHASRLAPLHDISADIQRRSTPPRDMKERDHGYSESQKTNLPDLWPWLPDIEDGDEKEDGWSNRPDPLISRRVPTSFEAGGVGAEDAQRAMAEGTPTNRLPRIYQQAKRLRVAFICLAVVAVLALVVDSLLASVAFFHHTPKPTPVSTTPSLALSESVVATGQTITIKLSHFSPSSQVLLTHDIEMVLPTSTGSALIPVDRNGDAQAQVTVPSNWGPGFHNIDGEDIQNRDTASATLRVNNGPTRPAHLFIALTMLDLGAAPQGAITTQPLMLSNSGGGSITWSVSSNQPWLMVTPPNGQFSDGQSISVAGERASLKPGDYQGTLTFSSNVGDPETVQVQMTVRPLPTDRGPVLSISPPVLSFTAVDGGAQPAASFLVINNPGSKPLSWSVASSVQSSTIFGFQFNNWLSTDQTSGTVAPNSAEIVHVMANSNKLLPSTYTGTLLFTGADNAINSPQSVSVSLTVQQRCRAMVSTADMSFTAISGQPNPGDQVVNMSATSTCANNTSWQATSLAPWLTVNPTKGTWQGNQIPLTVSVNISGLTASSTPLDGSISITMGQNTQTIMVQLTVQPPPPPNSPILLVTPLNLNFSATAGQSRPPNQAVTIANTGGGSALNWRTQLIAQANTWFAASPSGGSLAPKQTQPLTIAVGTNGLTPGNYTGQVIISATDSNNQPVAGSSQTISINLVVLPPCALAQPSSSSLAFSATQGGSQPPSQSVTLTVSGNCAWPLNWNATVTSPASWLNISSPTSGSLNASGQSASLTIAPSITGLGPGTYTTQISLVATDTANMQAQGSPQLFTIALTVLPACTLQLSTSSLSFSVTQGSASSPQTAGLSESGNCALPVSWNAADDSGSSSWLVLSKGSGSDSGSGDSLDVSVDATNLAPGTYTGSINFSAHGNDGVTIQNGPQSISITVTVTAPATNGTSDPCSDSSCATPTTTPTTGP